MLNTRIMAQPLNWLIVVMMVLVAWFAFGLIAKLINGEGL